mmetsp:Transcript_2249/g.2721  ORF Transcript_2249/g.2721 Transcript_2249/m.2721 type:complete len:84 (+) Transcript_2249:116-367(+)
MQSNCTTCNAFLVVILISTMLRAETNKLVKRISPELDDGRNIFKHQIFYSHQQQCLKTFRPSSSSCEMRLTSLLVSGLSYGLI